MGYTIKIRKSIVEQYLNDYADEIQHMDDYTFPEIMLELQVEEADEQNIDDHTSITAFSWEALANVFPCWFTTIEADDWFEEMVSAEEALQLQEKENGTLNKIENPVQ